MKRTSLGKTILISIYSIIIVVLIWNWFREYYNFVEHHKMYGGYDKFSFPSIMQIMAITSVFRVALLTLPIGFGILVRRKIGWVLITSYLYFLIINALGLRIEDAGTTGLKFWILSICFAIVVCLLIFVMSKSKVVKEFHKIKHQNIITLNIMAFGVGLALFALLFVWKNYMLQQWL